MSTDTTTTDTEFSGFSIEYFSGFVVPPEDDSIAFNPVFASSKNQSNLDELLRGVPSDPDGLCFDYSKFSDFEDIDLSSYSEQSEEAMSDQDMSEMEDLQASNVHHESIPEESLLDLSAPFNVSVGDEGSRTMLITNGAKGGGDLIMSEGHGRSLSKNRTLKDGNMTFTCASNFKLTGCRAQCTVKDPNVIMRERGDERGTDVHVYYIEMGKDFWEATENCMQHSVNCPTIPGNLERILFLNECKKLALKSEYDSWGAMAILKLAKDNVCSANLVKDFFPKEQNTCKMINRIRQEIRARPPKKDGSN